MAVSALRIIYLYNLIFYALDRMTRESGCGQVITLLIFHLSNQWEYRLWHRRFGKFPWLYSFPGV